MRYKERITDRQIVEYLKLFGGVLIEGPKWCGKTSSGKHMAESVFELANPEHNFQNRTLARLNVSNALEGKKPHLIDEWQEVPEIWDAVRYQSDEVQEKGMYLLTGSSTPDDALTIHSGAGRIGRVMMSTMSLSEMGLFGGAISLGELLYGEVSAEIVRKSTMTLDNLIEVICRGGWPGLIGLDTTQALRVLRNYVETLTLADCSRIDGVERNPAKVLALLQSLSRNAASLVSKTTIIKDIERYDSAEISRNTVDDYLNVLRRLFIVQEIPAWSPALKSYIKLRSTPKTILFDQSLAVAALRTTPVSLKKDLKFLGNLFENLVLHELMIYAQANEAKVFYYHDDSDFEVDAVIEGLDGSWGAIEVKLSYDSEDEAAKNLLKLEDKLDKTKQSAPKFLAVVVGVGGILHLRSDGVWVVPIDCLGR